VARTVAPIEETANIEPKHIAEGIQYPSLDRHTGVALGT
jgi:predicted ATPase with chaperone activity